MVGNVVRIVGNNAYISRYEVMEAFFRTEEDGNEAMASKLNEMLNVFCYYERKNKCNIVTLPFDKIIYKNVIEYIVKSI